jgi:hypothetical protein
MEKFEVRFLVYDAGGKTRHWRKRIKATDPYSAGQEGQRRCYFDIMRGFVLRRGFPGPVAMYPVAQSGLLWATADDLTLEQFAKWTHFSINGRPWWWNGHGFEVDHL